MICKCGQYAEETECKMCRLERENAELEQKVKELEAWKEMILDKYITDVRNGNYAKIHKQYLLVITPAEALALKEDK